MQQHTVRGLSPDEADMACAKLRVHLIAGHWSAARDILSRAIESCGVRDGHVTETTFLHEALGREPLPSDVRLANLLAEAGIVTVGQVRRFLRSRTRLENVGPDSRRRLAELVSGWQLVLHD